MVEAGRESELSKHKFEEKIERLEQDAAQTRSDLVEAQIRLRDLEDQSLHRGKHSDTKNDAAGPETDTETHCERIKRHQREISRYENRLIDMAKLLDLTGRSPRKYVPCLTIKLSVAIRRHFTAVAHKPLELEIEDMTFFLEINNADC